MLTASRAGMLHHLPPPLEAPSNTPPPCLSLPAWSPALHRNSQPSGCQDPPVLTPSEHRASGARRLPCARPFLPTFSCPGARQFHSHRLPAVAVGASRPAPENFKETSPAVKNKLTRVERDSNAILRSFNRVRQSLENPRPHPVLVKLSSLSLVLQSDPAFGLFCTVHGAIRDRPPDRHRRSQEAWCDANTPEASTESQRKTTALEESKHIYYPNQILVKLKQSKIHTQWTTLTSWNSQPTVTETVHPQHLTANTNPQRKRTRDSKNTSQHLTMSWVKTAPFPARPRPVWHSVRRFGRACEDLLQRGFQGRDQLVI